MLETLRKEVGAPGLAAAIVVDGEVIWRGGVGLADTEAKVPMTPTVVGRAASVTKVLTGVALLIMRDAGQLSLDDPVATYVPEIAEVLYPSQDSPRITVRHLVTHSAGLPRLGELDYVTRADEGPTEAEVLKGLRGLALESEPGHRVTYSNLGASLAGIVVSRVSGMSYEAFVNSQILGPLGMKSSAWSSAGYAKERMAKGYPKPDIGLVAEHHWRFGAANAAGGLYLDVEDLARFARFQLSAWPPSDEADSGLLRRGSIRESHRLAGGGYGGGGHGVFWLVSKAGRIGHLVGHTGATDKYSSSVFLAPEKGVGVVVMANLGMGVTDGIAGKLLAVVAAALEPGPMAIPPPLLKGLERVTAMVASPTADAVRTHVASAYRAQIPESAFVGLFQQLANATRACKVGAPIEIRDATLGRFWVECEGVRFRLGLGVEPEAPHSIIYLELKPE